MKTFLLLLLVLSVYSHDKILLENVKSLTLHNNQYTTGRRGQPVIQLNCIGGSAQSEFHKITTVQCTNTGFDGKDSNWKCESQMSNSLKFGTMSVTCEGYDYPNDRYVLVGSCGLKYTLDYTPAGLNKPVIKTNTIPYTSTTTTYYTKSHYSQDAVDFFVMIGLLMVFFFFISCLVSCMRRSSRVIVSGPMDRYARPTNPLYVTSPPSSFVDGMIIGSTLRGCSTPAHTHTHTHTTFGSSDFATTDASDHTSTGYAETERR